MFNIYIYIYIYNTKTKLIKDGLGLEVERGLIIMDALIIVYLLVLRAKF